ncbi:LamG domain-containing protein, partial [Candidatus Gracilibacteria bacterium]|nr:LamG domain-containing protein [Candidatus Gracilibacteria bacterium]
KDYDNSLVGYWDMETICESGNCGSGNDGKLKDLSGNGNDGIFSGTILPTLTGGHIGKGFYFTKSDNRIFIPSFTVSTYSDKFANGYTISAVVMKQTDGTTQGRIFGGFDAPLLYFDEYEKPIIIHYNIKNKYSGTRTLDYQNSNKFLFIVGIWDTNSQKIYINGILNNKNIVLDRLKISASTSNVTIGTASDINGTVTDSAYSFPGIIDDIKIYNRALSDEEIKQHAKIAGF